MKFNYQIRFAYMCLIFVIKECEFLVINNENCVNDNLLTSRCVFNISIKPPISKPLKCRFQFITPNGVAINVTIKEIKLMTILQDKCPTIYVKFGIDPKQQMETQCGGQAIKITRQFTNFTNGSFVYDNNNLTDTESMIYFDVYTSNQTLCVETLTGSITERKTTIIIIGVAIAILLIISLIIIVFVWKRHGGLAKKSPDPETETGGGNSDLFSKNQQRKTKKNKKKIKKQRKDSAGNPLNPKDILMTENPDA